MNIGPLHLNVVTWQDLAAIFAGCICLLAAAFDGKYYAGRIAAGNTMPAWLGKLWFMTIGAFFIIVEFKKIFFD